MQSNQISAGQLMMSFMSKAKDDIREGIVSNEFSKELLAQSDSHADTGKMQAQVQGGTAMVLEDLNAQSAERHAPSGLTKDPGAQELKSGGRFPMQTEPSTATRRISEAKTREELFVADPLIVERILGHFQLPAEARESCLSSLNARGGVPFKTIAAVVEQYGQGSSSLQGNRSASAREVGEFVASIQLMQGLAPNVLKGIPVKTEGFYGVKEFKGLLKQVVDCVNEVELKKAALRDTGGKSYHGAVESGAEPAASAPVLADGLSTQLVQSGFPPFTLLNERKTHLHAWQSPGDTLPVQSQRESSQVSDATKPQIAADAVPEVLQTVPESPVTVAGSMEGSSVPPLQVSDVFDNEPGGSRFKRSSPHGGLQLASTPGQEEWVQDLSGGSDPGTIQGMEQADSPSFGATGPLEGGVFASPTAKSSRTDMGVFQKNGASADLEDSPLPGVGDHQVVNPLVEVSEFDAATLIEPCEAGPTEHRIRRSIASPEARESCSVGMSDDLYVSDTHAYQQAPIHSDKAETLESELPIAAEGQAFDSVDTSDGMRFERGNIPGEDGHIGTVGETSIVENLSDVPVVFDSHGGKDRVGAVHMVPKESISIENPWGETQGPLIMEGFKTAENSRIGSDDGFSIREKLPFGVRAESEGLALSETVQWPGRLSKRVESDVREPAEQPNLPSSEDGNSDYSSYSGVSSLGGTKGETMSRQESWRSDGFDMTMDSAYWTGDGSTEGIENLPEMPGSDTEGSRSTSDVVKGPPGINLANTSPGRGVTFNDRLKSPEQREDFTIERVDEIFSSESVVSGNPAAPSAPRPTLNATSFSVESQGASTDSLSLEDAGWPEELGRRLTQLREREGNQLSIELAPKHLGKLVLQVETHRDQVIAWLSTDNEQARNLLMQNAPLLRQQLQEQGLVLGQLHVSVGQEGQEKNSHRRFESSHGKGESGKSIEKLQSSKRSSLGQAYRSIGEDRRISLFA